MYDSKILAFGNCMPEKRITNDDLSRLVETSDEWIYSRTGIRERRISIGENTSDLCTEAALKAIRKSGVSPADIDLIIVATITPDYSTPSTACVVQKNIGALKAVAFDLSAACSGFVFALSAADKFIKTGTFEYALVIGGETLSKIVDWSDRGTCVLFGDGAGACVMKRSEKPAGGIIAEDLHSDGELFDSLTAGYSPVSNPFSSCSDGKRKKWIEMNGREIFNFATRKIPLSIKNVIEKAHASLDDVKYIVPHQANSRIVEVIAKKLKLPMEKFYMNMDKYGNTSAASIPAALGEMEENGLLEENDRIIITGFGGGLTWGSALIEI